VLVTFAHCSTRRARRRCMFLYAMPTWACTHALRVPGFSGRMRLARSGRVSSIPSISLLVISFTYYAFTGSALPNAIQCSVLYHLRKQRHPPSRRTAGTGNEQAGVSWYKEQGHWPWMKGGTGDDAHCRWLGKFLAKRDRRRTVLFQAHLLRCRAFHSHLFVCSAPLHHSAHIPRCLPATFSCCS